MEWNRYSKLSDIDPTLIYFKFVDELSHTHFGMILNNVDMRGEVALLTRNIVIEAETQPICPQQNGNCDQTGNLDTFGGHVKVFYS